MRSNCALCLDKIYVGMFIKNQREFCDLLGVEYIDSTSSRKRQLEEWSRYLSFERKGRGFIITEIKEVPDVEPFDKNSFYDIRILAVLYHYIKWREENATLFPSYTLTTSDLLYICGFTSERFSRINREELLTDLTASYDCKLNQASYLYTVLSQWVFSTFPIQIENSLSRIVSRGLLNWKKSLWIKTEKENREASAEEELVYEEICSAAMEELGIKRITPKWGSSYRKLVKALVNNIGWNNAWRLHEISLPSDRRQLDKFVLENRFDGYQEKLQINENVCKIARKRILTDMEKDLANATKLFEISDIDPELTEIFWPTPEDKYDALNGDGSVHNAEQIKEHLIVRLLELNSRS